MVKRNHRKNEREPRGTSLQLDLQIVIKVLDDLGMSDAEIRRYFGSDGDLIAAISNFSKSCAHAKSSSGSAISLTEALSRQKAID